jgi:hypothetical protein
MFARRASDGMIVPTSQLGETLAQARSLYGAGMGYSSLRLLAMVVRKKWNDKSCC